MILLKLFMAFGFVAVVSFVLFYALLKHQSADSQVALEKNDKAGKKQLKQKLKGEKWSWHNVITSKWVAFGGGFYGVMAVVTYVVVEIQDLVDFFTSEAGFIATVSEIGVRDLINLLIESLMNFITAITWPVYWINKLTAYPIWVWFLVVYAGYTCGQMLAKYTRNPYLNENP